MAQLTEFEELTEREIEVLKVLAEGKTNEQIAEALGIAPTTAKTHVQNIFSKFYLTEKDGNNRVIAVIMGLKNKLINLSMLNIA